MTKFDPKVVSFDRNASYLHEKALKNQKNGAGIEALELLRKACEQEPENVKYRMDLAGLYSEMGLHEQAMRVFTQILLKDNSEIQCLYGMAVNLYRQGEISRAERALRAYADAESESGRRADARRLMDEITIAREIGRPGDRRLLRAMRLAAEACDRMNEGNGKEGARLFEKCLAIREYSREIRALYAHSLMSVGRNAEALEQAEKSLKRNRVHPSRRALWLCAQVFEQLGENEKSRELMERALSCEEAQEEMHLQAFILMDAEKYEEAEKVINRLLAETPYEKQLLHMLSAARFNAGFPDEETAQGWRRIQRLDAFDPVADFYLRALEENTMPEKPLSYAYAIPVAEAIRRVKYLTDRMLLGEEALRDAWVNDAQFRKILEWEMYQKDSRITRLALGVLMNINLPETHAMLRLFSERPDVPMQLRLYAMYLVRITGAPLLQTLGSAYSQAAMPCEEELMNGMNVSEKQIVRLAAEYIEENFMDNPTADIALIWKTYKEARGLLRDPVRRTEVGSAALALFYMEMRGYEGDVFSVSRYFGCPARQTAFVAKSIRSVFHGNIENE